MISIFTPTHDSRYLLEAYESLKQQTVSEWEWIILYNNDAEPVDIDDSRVKQYRAYNAKPWVGLLKACACDYATGDILLELDHDDLLFPTALEEVEKAFSDPEVGFVYSNTVHCTGEFGKIERFDERYGWEYREAEWNGHVLDEHVSFAPSPNSVGRIWFAPNHLRAFRRSTYEEIGGYNREMRILDDLDLMCRLYKASKFHHIDKPLYLYRVHGSNTWLKHNQEIQENVFRIHDQYIEDLAKKWAADNGLEAIELGGRFNRKDGYKSVDLRDADICADLNMPWPFADNSIGVVRAFDVFEHLHDPLYTMKELYRVLAPGGYAIIQVPSTDGRGAFADPTHVSFWNEQSFKYYSNADFAKYIDTPVRFQAMRLYTTEKDNDQVCWTVAHLVKLTDQRVPGLVLI